MTEISQQQARHLHLAAQGLLTKPRRRARRADVPDIIRRMRLLQIDTIHVVARSPYLVLFSRLGDYEPTWLDEALTRGEVFECWSHEACFAPSEDYPWLSRVQRELSTHWSQRLAQRIQREHGAAMRQLLAHVREKGEVKSAHFERKDGGGGGWWGWKAEKRWLESWFALGELMIARRERFARVYDLRERVLARMGIDAESFRDFTHAQLRELQVIHAVRALGITQARWIADYFRMGKRLRDGDLEPLVASGVLRRVTVRGWDNVGYVHADHDALLASAARQGLRATHTTLLSPFDPVVWDRERAAMMFDFDYRIECYTPAPKRQFGYFVLPILRRGHLVGRLDAKAHRVAGQFEVKAIYLQEGVKIVARLVDDIAGAIAASARWHGTPRVVVKRARPTELLKPLRAALAEHA